VRRRRQRQADHLSPGIVRTSMIGFRSDDRIDDAGIAGVG
jgi:hypothetical protein